MRSMEYKIKDICQIRSGKRLPAGESFVADKTDYKYIRARDIKNGKIDTSDLAYISYETHQKIQKYIINKGDIALTIAGTVGEIGFAGESVDGVNLTENAVRLTEFKKDIINSKYLMYLLSQKQYKSYMQVISGGVAQPKLGIYKIEKMTVSVPPIRQQDKIATILSAYDDLIEKNNRKVAILQEMAEELYKEWFVRFRFPGYKISKFKDGIPENWETKFLREWLVDDFNGGWGNDVSTQKTPYEAFVIRGTDIEDIKNAIIDDVPRRYHKSSDMNTKMLKEYDIVLELSNGNINNIGRTLFIDKQILNWFDKVMCASFCKTLRFKDKKTAFLVWQYINYLQNSGLMLYYKNTGANGINNFNFKRFLEMQISIPRNLNCVDDLMRYYDTISLLNGANYTLRKQRDLLLPRLMSGKLEVKA